MNDLIPQTGMKGHFVLHAPLESLIGETVVLECVSVRDYGEIIAAGRDPYTSFYEPLGLPQSDYVTHSQKTSYIIGLRSESGKVYRIPSPYIKSFPIVGGVPYELYALSVLLGALPQDVPLHHVEQAVLELVRDLLGTAPIAKLVKVSPTVYKSSADSEALEQARKNQIALTQTDRARANELQRTVDLLRKEVTDLTSYIEDNIS